MENLDRWLHTSKIQTKRYFSQASPGRQQVCLFRSNLKLLEIILHTLRELLCFSFEHYSRFENILDAIGVLNTANNISSNPGYQIFNGTFARYL